MFKTFFANTNFLTKTFYAEIQETFILSNS